MTIKYHSLFFLSSVFVLSCCAPLEPLEHTQDMSPVIAAPTMPVRAETMSSEQRIQALEQELTSLRQEMNLIRPTITHMMTENKLSEKVAQVKTVPKQQAAPKSVQKTAVKANVPSVSALQSIRTGEHTGKTRLVMDIGKKAPYTYDLDQTEGLLVIELPQTSAPHELAKALKTSPYISGYQTRRTETGSRIIVQLKSNARVLYKEEIKPTGKYGYRVFFDIGA